VNENLTTQAVIFEPELPLVRQECMYCKAAITESLIASLTLALVTAEESDVLKRLIPVEAANYDEDHSCMEGTRTAILDNIIAWAACPFEGSTQSNHSESNVFWLYSMPGLGKTSVANSLCDRLRKGENLGGCFFCKHDNADLREPKRVLPTLIAKLAQMWSPFRKLVAMVLLDEPHINPESTRGELLLKPLQLLKKHPPRPLVFVIDALDECGQPNARGLLLNCLAEACSLVHWLKIVVTSRPEPDIKSFFDRKRINSRDLATDDLKRDDIHLFTQRRMASVASRRHLSPSWPGAERVSQIVERSRGLFIFVDTLSRLVNVPKPEPLLAQVLNGKLEEANAELHKLYSTVVITRAVGHIGDLQSMLRAVIAVSAYRPLCAETLAKLINLEVPTILSWLDELSSLLYQDAAEGNGIRVRHLSVLEFLVGSTCPPKFRVDQKLANSELTRYCLVTMANELRFNICGLESACLSNADIRDLDNRVERRIPDTLRYSCMHWSNHLCYDTDPISAEIAGILDDFFEESKPLYWIEVLSLMGTIPIAISSMRLIKGCFKVWILTLCANTN
jgi:NACHT domain